MTSDSTPYVPFSQRTGLEPVPPQLKLGEVSAELRRLLYYYISLEIDRESYTPYSSAVFNEKWQRVAKDLHVLFFKRPPDKFDYGAYENKKRLGPVDKGDSQISFAMIQSGFCGGLIDPGIIEQQRVGVS